MIRLALALLVLILALLPTPARAQPQRPPLLVAAGEVREGDLATLEQPILVDGVVEGDVTSWSGAITVNGEVRGDVVSYAGTVTLGPSARVGGSVLAMAGGVQGESAAVAGQLLGAEPVAGSTMVAGMATLFGRQPETVGVTIPRPLVSGFLAFAALACCVLLAAIWPTRTAGVARALGGRPLRATGLGLLTTLLGAVALPPLASLLALSLVGLPLLVPVLLVLQLPYLFGLAALGRLLMERAAPGRAASPALAAGLGALPVLLPLVVVGAAAPLTSAAIFYLVSGAGLGAAILSRGGAYALREA